MYHFYVGLDLGQSQDYTALAVIEEPLWIGGDEWKRAFGLLAVREEGSRGSRGGRLQASRRESVGHHHSRRL